MNLFCKLPKDMKTFDILKKYIEDVQKGIDIFKEDCEIQKIEMETHMYITGEDGIKWIEKHANGERVYLNTIKEIAIIFICTDRECNFENFCFFVKKMNLITDCVLNKIHN